MIHPPDISFFKSRNIKDYKAIITGLRDVFYTEHWEYILTWCGVIDNDGEDFGKYWEVWLIEVQQKIVGICGLYSLQYNDNKELWLGWFGILAPYRNNGIGKVALEFMGMEARKAGCKKLSTYVSSDHAFKFYQNNGFEYITLVAQYVLDNPELKNYFGEPRDYIISKEIDLTKSNNIL